MRFSIGLLAIVITSSLLGTCAASSAPKEARESASESSGQVWSLQTPFGIIYERIPSQEVDYPSTRPAGTIVVNISKRRLYYVQGDGRAISYGIAVGMEGYGWSGVSTVSAKREWPDWTPTPNILKRFPNLPRHMAGGPDNPLGARALYLGGNAIPHSWDERALEARWWCIFRLHSTVQR
jgi:lipoprotein-anchoring transpeptidase ErfK/SrfK